MGGAQTHSKDDLIEEGYCYDEIKTTTLHYPSLKTVLMVESKIEKEGEIKNKNVLWKSLPKKVMYQTLNVILDYLVYSHKIIISEDGTIVWVWNPKLVDKVVKGRARSL